MRADEFIKEEEKLNEILPLIIGAANLAGGAASLAGGIARGAGAVASGVGKGIGAAAKGAGRAVGAVGNKAAQAMGMGSDDAVVKPTNPAIDRAKDQMIRPGQKIKLPTAGTGGEEEFKVTRLQGDEVEIENPEGNKQPNQPNKIVYKKDDLKKSMAV